MQKTFSTTNPGMLVDVPYGYLIKHEATGAYEVYYAIEVDVNYVAQDTPPIISGTTVFVTVNLLYQEGAPGGLISSHQDLPTLNDGGEEITKVEVIGQKYPTVEPMQPQRSGVIIINYKDADE